MGKVDPRLRQDVAALAGASDALTRLEAVRRLRERVETMETDLVAAARDEGLSWTTIGAVYGMSKQGAQQRFRASTKRRAGRRGAGDPKTSRGQLAAEGGHPPAEGGQRAAEGGQPGGAGR